MKADDLPRVTTHLTLVPWEPLQSRELVIHTSHEVHLAEQATCSESSFKGLRRSSPCALDPTVKPPRAGGFGAVSHKSDGMSPK